MTPEIGRLDLHHTTHEDGGTDEINATGLVGAGGDPGEGHIALFGEAYSAIVAGTWTFTVLGAQIHNGLWVNTSHALNDEIEYKVFLAPGTYTLEMLYLGATYAGIGTFYIDGVAVGTVDEYVDPQTPNLLARITGIVVSTAGLKTLTIKVTGKHASSSDYYFLFGMIALFRTA